MSFRAKKYLKLTACNLWICFWFLLTGCTIVLRKSWSMCCDCETVAYFLYEGDILLCRLNFFFPQANYQWTNKHKVQDVHHSKVFGLKLTCSHGPILSTFKKKNHLCYLYVTRILFVRKISPTSWLPAENFCLGSAKR